MTGTGSLHFAEVSAWSEGARAHAEFEAKCYQDLIAIHRALDIDVLRMPWRMNRRPSRRIDEFTFLFGDAEGDHEAWKYNPDSADFGMVKRSQTSQPAEDVYRLAIERREQNPTALRNSAEREVRSIRELQAAAGDEFFVIGATGMIMVGSSEEDLLLLARDPDLVRRKMMLQAGRAVELGNLLAASDCPKVLQGGGDLAGARGPMYSPESFRSVVLPAYKLAMKQLNAMGVHYAFRSDGNIWPLADMLFVEAACPGYGEADLDAGMTTAALRERYPELVIWGNVSSAALFHAAPEQVKAQSRRIIAGAGGIGYFHGCSNAIVKGTPPANVEAMYSVR